jgi:flagellar hook-length control protein FliK
MVQSISSTGNTNTSVELKTQNEQTSTSNSTDIEAGKNEFSKILEDNSASEMEATVTAAESIESLTDEQQSIEGLDDSLTAEAQESLLDIDLSIDSIDIETVELSDTTDLEMINFDDANYGDESIDDIDAQEPQQSQLLSNIQSAQKANTTVNNVEEGGQDIAQVGSKSAALDTINTNAKTTQSLVDTASVDNASTEEIDLIGKTGTTLVGQQATNKESDSLVDEIGVDAAASSESVDDLSALLKSDKSVVNQVVVDANGAKPIQTNAVQADKLVAVNQQTQTTNNLLEEPLDIQSKQVASILGERVMMMMSQGKQEVQIRLDPAELGSMFIKVNMQQDEVQLNIQTQAHVAKDIIDQNMPRLRDQLAQQGIQLGDANVEQQAQQQSQQQNNAISNSVSKGNNGVENAEEAETAQWIPSPIASSTQGIDYYA